MAPLRLLMRWWLGLAMLLVLLVTMKNLHAQAMPTASGGGQYIAVGGGVSGFQADYGQRILGGGFVYVDANATQRYGLEAEGRYLDFHTDEDVTESTYLGGGRVVVYDKLLQGLLLPYVKVLAGVGKINLPFNYAKGSFLVIEPSVGVDYYLSGRWSARLDLEYQDWPKFSFGALHPYGVSVGISYRVTGFELFPKGTRHKH